MLAVRRIRQPAARQRKAHEAQALDTGTRTRVAIEFTRLRSTPSSGQATRRIGLTLAESSITAAGTQRAAAARAPLKQAGGVVDLAIHQHDRRHSPYIAGLRGRLQFGACARSVRESGEREEHASGASSGARRRRWVSGLQTARCPCARRRSCGIAVQLREAAARQSQTVMRTMRRRRVESVESAEVRTPTLRKAQRRRRTAGFSVR